jgi:transcriptional regulator
MYPDKKFLVENPAEIQAFIEQYPFATLVASDSDGKFAATHVPLLIQSWSERIIFRGHIMRETDHWVTLKQSPSVFVSFLGPDAPILGSWQLTQRFGGTWNYQAVHAQGVLQWRSQQTLAKHLEELKNRFETSADHGFHSLPLDYVDALLPLIECIDIVVADIRCIFKLSQNRGVEEFDRTVEGLRQKGGKSALVAAEMQARRAQYYRDEV